MMAQFIFQQLDTTIGQYYKSHNIDDYFDDDGIGRFLKYVQQEEMDETEIEAELGDDCTAQECGYLQFDFDNFPLDTSVSNDNEKYEKIFQVLQYCYKHKKRPPSMFQNKLISLQNDINSIITQQMNQHIADTTSTTFVSAVKKEKFKMDDLINDIVDSDPNDSIIIDAMIDTDNKKNNDKAILHLHRDCIHQYIKLATDLMNKNAHGYYNCFNGQFLNEIVGLIERSFIGCYEQIITHEIQICFCLFVINNGLDDNKYQRDIIRCIKNDLFNIDSHLLTNIMNILLKHNYFKCKYEHEEDKKMAEIDENNINNDFELKDFERKRIYQHLEAILCGNKYFTVSDVRFQFDDNILEYGKKLVYDHCRMIYSKHPGDFKANDPFRDERNKNNIGDKALCIAKCIELENGYPILSMLLDTFSRDRVNGHKINSMEHNLEIPDDRYAIRYDAIKWWKEDCIFGRYISNKYPNKAEAMMHAVAELSFRVLPKYNFQYVLSHIICDSLNAFAKYTISFHHIIHKIRKSMSLAGHCEAAPLQFDFWIIPQATKPTTRMNSIYDEKELYEDDEIDDDNSIEYEFEKQHENNLNNLADYVHENLIYNEMGKSGYHQKAQNAFWDLEEYLIKDGYKENIDYWVQGICGDIGAITEQITKIWKFSAGADMIRYKRYIFIIDRRNPINLKHKNMGYKIPNIDKCEVQWKDRIYLIAPKLTTKSSNNKLKFKIKDIQNISNKYYLVPEALLGYSKTYLFPNPDKDEPGPICILDAINGYKFCLSYHILQTDVIKVYWYTNQGSQRFKLDDMKWLWNKCFQKINNQWQILNNEIIELLNDEIYGKELVDVKFQQFWKQVHNTNNVDFEPFLTSNNELFRDQFKQF